MLPPSSDIIKSVDVPDFVYHQTTMSDLRESLAQRETEPMDVNRLPPLRQKRGVVDFEDPSLKDQPAALLREYIRKIFKEAEVIGGPLYFDFYEKHFPHEYGGLQQLYAVLVRCIGVLELQSVQLCHDRYRVGPFCILLKNQCAQCLDFHKGEQCPVRMYLNNQHKGTTMQEWAGSAAGDGRLLLRRGSGTPPSVGRLDPSTRQS